MTDVILYTQENCGPCATVKRFLQNSGITYKELGIEEAIAAGFRSTPVTVYGNTTILGFNYPALKLLKEQIQDGI